MIESTSPKFITIENVKGMLNKKNIDFYYEVVYKLINLCLLYTTPRPRDVLLYRMPSSALKKNAHKNHLKKYQ